MYRVHSGSLTMFHCPQTLVVGLNFHPAHVSVNRDLPLSTVDVMEVYTQGPATMVRDTEQRNSLCSSC